MDDNDPIICPDCGGTGLHPWMNDVCRRCNGTGEITEDGCFDERYKKTVYRAHRGCFDNCY